MLGEQQITTIEAAEALFSRSEAAWKGARKLLARMSKRRNPTLDEIDLYVKWTTDWGFAPKAVEAACAEMTKGDPSFGYLDGILNGLRKRSGGKALTEAEVATRITDEKEEAGNVREMLSAFGMSASVVDEGMRQVYRGMRELADPQVIVLAAQTAGADKNNKSLENVSALLASWNEKGLHDADAVKAYLADIKRQNDRLRKLFALAGRKAGCTQTNRELLRKWRDEWRMPDELQDAAAEMSKNVDKPMLYMDALLSGWRDEGIATAEAARAAHERFAQKAKKAKEAGNGKPKPTNEQNYEQRTYEPGRFDGLTDEQIEEMKRL